VFLLLAPLSWHALTGFAQSAVSTGALSGIVRDASGAVLPNVKVMLTGEATGVSLEATTNGDGIFGFPALQVGTYTASFSMAGFKKTQINNLSVGIGHTTDAEAVLALG